ncbi:hypothetical protein JXA84_02380 [candidate division WOR-3 bacterium]|nr:hypothetical protein [candidate division WOR-3 bacterium]
MKRSVFLVVSLSILSCGLLVKDNATVTCLGNSLSRENLELLYEEWFSWPYEYMFDGCDKNQMFLAGVNGILYYGSLAEAFTFLLEDGYTLKHYQDIGAIERISGIQILLKSEDFGYYNPEIIIWGYQNLIPLPEDEFLDQTYREVYHRVFQRFFRMMTESFLYLERERNVEQEAELYREKVVLGRVDALLFLEDRYKGVLEEYQVRDGYSEWTVGMAIGFWLRRNLDGTDVYLWEGLTKLMKLYDGEWFEREALGGSSYRESDF